MGPLRESLLAQYHPADSNSSMSPDCDAFLSNPGRSRRDASIWVCLYSAPLLYIKGTRQKFLLLTRIPTLPVLAIYRLAVSSSLSMF